MMQDITERIWCDCTDKHCDYREAVEEIKRLRAGGCARDQGTTQYCAEAARLAQENEQNAVDLEEYRRDVERLTAEVERLRKIIQETAPHFLMGVDNGG